MCAVVTELLATQSTAMVPPRPSVNNLVSSSSHSSTPSRSKSMIPSPLPPPHTNAAVAEFWIDIDQFNQRSSRTVLPRCDPWDLSSAISRSDIVDSRTLCSLGLPVEFDSLRHTGERYETTLLPLSWDAFTSNTHSFSKSISKQCVIISEFHLKICSYMLSFKLFMTRMELCCSKACTGSTPSRWSNSSVNFHTNRRLDFSTCQLLSITHKLPLYIIYVSVCSVPLFSDVNRPLPLPRT